MGKKNQEIYTVLGVMSGTSLDGLDMALCEFVKGKNNEWTFNVLKSSMIPFDYAWKERLGSVFNSSASELAEAHIDFGRFTGLQINDFLKNSAIRPVLISSHGHTVYHNSARGITFQIGSGAEIAAATGIAAACDFRTTDIALGGQGAPLVPVGDKILFGQYQSCLNLGGFSNISFDHNLQRVAFDICPVNIVLNDLATRLGQPYDYDGILARAGTINDDLLAALDSLEFYLSKQPKSLGREWVSANIMPLLDSAQISLQDKMRTMVEHIANQISNAFRQFKLKTVLATGGGTYNGFLMERIMMLGHSEIIVPDKVIVDYKEALVFAFLGLLRHLGQPNCYSSVTGAFSDCSGGAIYLPPLKVAEQYKISN